MLKWEIKKITKEKINIIALLLIAVLFLQIGFFKPMLETENKYWNESENEYFIDNRDKEVIANEKLKIKVEEISDIANFVADDKASKKIKDVSIEKLKQDNGIKYEDVDFYKVFSERTDFALSMFIMIIIIVLISSNLYIDEQISNVAPIILSSRNKKRVLHSKLAIAVLLPIIIYGLYIAGTGLITYIQYGQPLNGNLQAYRVSDMAALMKELTINQYIIMKMLTSTLILTGISIISLLSSFISSNSVKSIGLSISFIAIGKILTLFKFLPENILTLIRSSNYIDVMIGMSKISGYYNGNINILSKSFDISNLCIVIYVLIILFGVLGNIYCIKKALTR